MNLFPSIPYRVQKALKTVPGAPRPLMALTLGLKVVVVAQNSHQGAL